jgi:hypothetical protein
MFSETPSLVYSKDVASGRKGDWRNPHLKETPHCLQNFNDSGLGFPFQIKLLD